MGGKISSTNLSYKLTVMTIKQKAVRVLSSDNEIIKTIARLSLQVYYFLLYKVPSSRHVVERDFRKRHGYAPNLQTPETMNEKICWMKLYDRKRWYTFYADKYAVRDYIAETFGKQYLVPLLYETKNPCQVTPENIKEFPCIVKANHSSGQYRILRNPATTNWKRLQRDCTYWLSTDYYSVSKEYQYKYIERRIVVERLLQTNDGRIPNDYKLHYVNGKLAFIYVSFDREGGNYRCLYDKDWNKLPFVWVHKSTYRTDLNNVDVPKPSTLDEMMRMGEEVAKKFPRYVRVDFYDVDGRLYFGEITLHHGSGYDAFFPEEYDKIFGRQLIL